MRSCYSSHHSYFYLHHSSLTRFSTVCVRHSLYLVDLSSVSLSLSLSLFTFVKFHPLLPARPVKCLLPVGALFDQWTFTRDLSLTMHLHLSSPVNVLSLLHNHILLKAISHLSTRYFLPLSLSLSFVHCCNPHHITSPASFLSFFLVCVCEHLFVTAVHQWEKTKDRKSDPSSKYQQSIWQNRPVHSNPSPLLALPQLSSSHTLHTHCIL